MLRKLQWCDDVDTLCSLLQQPITLLEGGPDLRFQGAEKVQWVQKQRQVYLMAPDSGFIMTAYTMARPVLQIGHSVSRTIDHMVDKSRHGARPTGDPRTSPRRPGPGILGASLADIEPDMRAPNSDKGNEMRT